MIWFGGKRPDLERTRQACAVAMHAHLGIEAAAIGDDWLAIRMPVDHRTHQPAGRLHGGASVVLAAGASAGWLAGGLSVGPQPARPRPSGTAMIPVQTVRRRCISGRLRG